jgi:hypothetical protein
MLKFTIKSNWQTWGVRSWRCTLHRQDAGEITANEEKCQLLKYIIREI